MLNGRVGKLSGFIVPSPPDAALAAPADSFHNRRADAVQLTWQHTSLTTEVMEWVMLQKPTLAQSIESAAATEARVRQTENSSDKDLQRAKGACQLVVSGSMEGNRIVDIYQKFPLRVLFPRISDGRPEEAVLVNTSGGVAGGDHLQVNVTVMHSASIVVTTQAAEKIYRALDESAQIITKLCVEGSGKLAWLPQETILFNRARLCRRTEIEISSGSELLFLESLVFGRAAHGEELSAGAISDTWRVTKNGRLLWGDAFRVTDEVFPHLSRQGLLGGSKAIATLLYFGHGIEKPLELIRAQSDSSVCHVGATLVSGMVVVRLAARSSFELKAALRNLLRELGKELAPGPFQEPKMWSC